MNEMSDIGKLDPYKDEGELDPLGAARLLTQTQRQTERELDFRSPALSVLAAAAALIAFGSVWLSVRGQHPYKWPTPVGLIGLWVVIAIRIGSVLYAHHRAQAGVSGRSVRRHQADAAALMVALAVVYVFMAALAEAGASDGVVYGVYVATTTLIVLGAFGAAHAAARENWQELGISIAVMLVATISAFAGPRGVWLSDGIGLCVVLLAAAAVQAWLPSRSGSSAWPQ
jgi:hypothetical protein